VRNKLSGFSEFPIVIILSPAQGSFSTSNVILPFTASGFKLVTVSKSPFDSIQ
jgi:hypothetical protein